MHHICWLGFIVWTLTTCCLFFFCARWWVTFRVFMICPWFAIFWVAWDIFAPPLSRCWFYFALEKFPVMQGSRTGWSLKRMMRNHLFGPLRMFHDFQPLRQIFRLPFPWNLKHNDQEFLRQVGSGTRIPYLFWWNGCLFVFPAATRYLLFCRTLPGFVALAVCMLTVLALIFAAAIHYVPRSVSFKSLNMAEVSGKFPLSKSFWWEENLRLLLLRYTEFCMF